MRREVANVVAKTRPLGQQSVGQIEKLLEIAVPRREPLLGVEHRDPVAHVVEGLDCLKRNLEAFCPPCGCKKKPLDVNGPITENDCPIL
jgi:hypothetical protein